MRKLASLLLILVTLYTVPLCSVAEASQSPQVIELTLEECLSKAVSNSNQPTLIDKQIEALWKQENTMMEASNGIQQQLDMLERYIQLYKKWTTGGTLTPEDQLNLMMYTAMFGEKPPEYSSQEMFDMYIKNRDFPHYSAWAAVQNLKKNKELVVSSIKAGVKQIFDGIIDMQDTLLLQQELYTKMKKQNDNMLIKYKAGIISEIDKYASDISLEKQRLAVIKFDRSLENMKMSLKRQLDMSLKHAITLKPDDNSKGIKTVQPFQDYLKLALDNRAEVATAKMDLQVKQREDDIMKQYITCEVVDERMEADQALEDKTIAYTDAVNAVTADVTAGYKDVQLKMSSINISKTKLQNSEKSYNNAELQYGKGIISLSDFWNIEISYTQAKLAFNKAMRDYNNALYKLETACGIGPGYIKKGAY